MRDHSPIPADAKALAGKRARFLPRSGGVGMTPRAEARGNCFHYTIIILNYKTVLRGRLEHIRGVYTEHIRGVYAERSECAQYKLRHGTKSK